MRRYILFSFCVTLFLVIEAQTVLNVATQSFKEELPYTSGQVLMLQLEKAHVAVTGWDRDYFAFEIRLKSRHKNKEQAIKELSYLKYQLEAEGDTIHFVNDFVSGESFKKVQGMLNVELIVKAPFQSPVTIKNAYGATEVSGMSGTITLDGKFVDTQVRNCQGDLILTAVFGSNKINDQSGDFSFDLSRVDMTGHHIQGKVTGQANYGAIHFTRLSSADVSIVARRTTFTVELELPIGSYSYDLSSDLGNIFLEGSLEEKKSSKWTYQGTSDSKINIKTSFSPITIRDKSLNAFKK